MTLQSENNTVHNTCNSPWATNGITPPTYANESGWNRLCSVLAPPTIGNWPGIEAYRPRPELPVFGLYKEANRTVKSAVVYSERRA